MSEFKVETARSESILLLETEKAVYLQHFEVRSEPITGGMTVESKIERQPKGKSNDNEP